ncbi:hypothetical protein PILCRDRAFT_428144 [Piloderma croceum F 1598]|uniref:Uncharacterized protein n=1 Tax=Piloderma croceum (strain F 1598) TaxID=765440 RepID=A0A0C3FZ14_PILCF|nr:hypothetical protein PILCRDRAFT_428144 [Piloderma croceum F 1598]
MHLRYTNKSQEFLLAPRFDFPRANVVAIKQSEHFPTSSVSHNEMQPYNSDGHWPADTSQPDNPNALAIQPTFYTERNSVTNMVRSDLQYGDGRTGFWPVSENPPHRQDVSISAGSEGRLGSHENASYCATGWSAASHIPIATSGVQLFTTRENDATRTGLGVSSGNNCISQDALTYPHDQRHHPDPYLVERAPSNRPYV